MSDTSTRKKYSTDVGEQGFDTRHACCYEPKEAKGDGLPLFEKPENATKTYQIVTSI